MKKKFWSLLAIMMATTMSVSFVSCGDDDDNNGLEEGNPSTSAGIIDPSSGLRLKSIGNYTVNYTKEGLFDYVIGYSDAFKFSYNPNVITYNDRERSSDTCFVIYNKNGWISSYEIKSHNDEAYGTGTCNFSYDNDGHLLSISESSTWTEDEEQYSETERTTFTWEGGLLIKWEQIYKDDEDGQSTTSCILNYGKGYERYENRYKQYTNVLSHESMDLLNLFLHLGLLGVGPEELPSSLYFSLDDGGYSYDERKTFTYEFNNDGSISYANGMHYTYEKKK